jgi:hypothetical protein
LTDLASLSSLAAAQSLRTLGPFPTPSAAIAAMAAGAADAFDEARWVALRTTDAGMLLVSDDARGLPAELPRQTLAELTDKRERHDLLQALHGAGLPATCPILWDAENLGYFVSAGHAMAWRARRRPGRDSTEALQQFGLWLAADDRGERGVVLAPSDEGAMLQASFLLRKKSLPSQFLRERLGDGLIPFPRAVPNYDRAAAKALADQLAETEPGPRTSVAKYVAYLGPHRCRAFAEVAAELHGAPDRPLSEVHAQMGALGYDLVALTTPQPPVDPRVSVHGPRTLGGVWFQLMSRWVGSRLAGWIERQP